MRQLEKSRYSCRNQDFSPEELRTFQTVKEIVEGGGQIEIKKSNGVLTVYEVSMRKLKE